MAAIVLGIGKNVALEDAAKALAAELQKESANPGSSVAVKQIRTMRANSDRNEVVSGYVDAAVAIIAYGAQTSLNKQIKTGNFVGNAPDRGELLYKAYSQAMFGTKESQRTTPQANIEYAMTGTRKTWDAFEMIKALSLHLNTKMTVGQVIDELKKVSPKTLAAKGLGTDPEDALTNRDKVCAALEKLVS